MAEMIAGALIMLLGIIIGFNAAVLLAVRGRGEGEDG